jgi:hypothetical protein
VHSFFLFFYRQLSPRPLLRCKKVERLAATAMHSADLAAIAEIGALLSSSQCDQMDVLLSVVTR